MLLKTVKEVDFYQKNIIKKQKEIEVRVKERRESIRRWIKIERE
ncbi:hypothetical protein CIN_21730 [Commensalibacter intestini A911]|uniref:Uncharacterized protein n=1 Tax=Commensalibacter intestini A911 TaxID=1088868 RepID=G6F3H7_9PROT|nr:hypothetical protein CIN_21730 [Commensalibacter intestini A911]